ncbi:MAG: DegT/DnrJ/EryC1/StrS family aminotransferase [Meiothermus sp.]|nr:DegT/DnrJ/EryC1/StrS family aminotransferase [Meiothermus sp.]
MSTATRRVRKGFNHVDEAMREALLGALESRNYYLGPENEAFEAELANSIGVRHAVAVNSGTSAMMLILRALGIGPGDEVIVPAMGFVTLAEAVAVVGATPRFADVEEQTFNLEPDQAAAAISEKTRAIVPAHKYGHPAEMGRLKALAERHGVYLLEDFCHALGAQHQGQYVGGIGAAGFVSFAGKTISVCGLGGMVTTNNDDLAQEVRLLRDHGRPRAKGQRFYEIHRVGYNLRLSELHAAVGRVQLRRIEEWNQRRRENAALYNRLFAERGLPVVTPQTLPGCTHAFLHYTLRVPEGRRDALQKFLADAGVESTVLYPQDLHLLPPYQALCGHREGDFPVSERLTREVLSLPNHPDVNPEDIQAVVDGVERFYG